MDEGLQLLDGATGTELRARGVRVPSHRDSIWSAAALTEAPDEVVAVHRAYLAAGADVVTANNYAVTPPLLARVGCGERLEEWTRTAVALARRAREESGRAALVAGSFPPLETSYRADLVPPDAELRAGYRRIRDALCAGEGVDLVLCETLSCAREARVAAEVALESGRPVWVSFTLQGNRAGRLAGGEPLAQALAAVADLALAGLAVNCCGVNLVDDALPTLRAAAAGRPCGAWANADDVLPGPFDPHDPESVPRRALDPEAYARRALAWVEAGATWVGGCCDTRPAHIAALARALRGRTRPT